MKKKRKIQVKNLNNKGLLFPTDMKNEILLINQIEVKKNLSKNMEVFLEIQPLIFDKIVNG